MARTRAVGIDLGTTYSAAAWISDAGKSAMIPNSDGDTLTPSVVLFEDREVIVGKEAKRAGALRAGRVAATVKRDMGNLLYSKPIRGEYMPPEVIQAFILRKLRSEILEHVGPDHQVVITVPAFFDEPRRSSTAHAGDMAGLNVLDIVNEPMAAALAFGEQLGYLTRGGAPQKQMSILVYDLGGGTFDVTLVDMQPGHLTTVATDGDVRLGGHDWDLRLVDHAAEAFIREHREDPRQNPGSLQRLLVEVEQAKHTLSARNSAAIRVEHSGSSSDVTVTRELFDQLTADLLERTSHTTGKLLSTAGRTWDTITHVLLVGGSTRMPMVARMLKELSGKEPDRSVHPDEAVARGAAIYAQYFLSLRSGNSNDSSLHVTNVNSHSLGIEGIEPQTLRKCNAIVIPRNTPLPTRITKEFATKSQGQRSIEIQVLEGESTLPEECTPIGRTAIRDLPMNLSQGSPVDVTYEYAANGRLSVRARLRATGKEVNLDLIRDRALSQDRVNQWKRVLAGSGGLDAAGGLMMPRPASMGSPAELTTVPATVSPSPPSSAPVAGDLTAASRPIQRPVPIPAAVAIPLDNAPANTTGAKPVDDASAEKQAKRSRARALRTSSLGTVIGHLIASLLGLAIGYYILCCVAPAEYNYFNLPTPGGSQSSSPAPEPVLE